MRSMERHERLRQARGQAGFSSAAEASRRIGISYGTYSGHENGLRGMKDEDLRTYAKVFKVPLAWLAFGEESEQQSELHVIGVLQGNGTVETKPYSANSAYALDEVTFRPIKIPFLVNSGISAVRILPGIFAPLLGAGDIFLVWEQQRFEIKAYLGEQAFILLNSGKYMHGCLKVCSWDNERFNLELFNSTTIEDIDVKQVHEIVALVKGATLIRAAIDQEPARDWGSRLATKVVRKR